MNLPCLPLVQERFIERIRPHIQEEHWYPDIEMYMFPQMWGSTALGFGGVGGCAMTSAYTTVVAEVQYGYYGVFFGERMAYWVDAPNDAFFDDLRAGAMESVSRCGKYNK